GFRELVILDVGILDAGAEWPHVITEVSHAIAKIGNPLDVHDLLMIAAIVVHYRKQRNFMSCRGPEHTWRVHEVAVGLNRNREAAEIAVRRSRATCRRRSIANAIAARAAQPVIVPLHRP